MLLLIIICHRNSINIVHSILYARYYIKIIKHNITSLKTIIDLKHVYLNKNLSSKPYIPLHEKL